MSNQEEKTDERLRQFYCSRYFHKFERTLGYSNGFGRDVGGLLGELGISHQEYQVLDSRRSILWEGIKAVSKREEFALTLDRLMEAVKEIRRPDALEVIFKFLNKHEKGTSHASVKRSRRWLDLLKFRKSFGLDDDSISMTSESTLRSSTSVLSVASTVSTESSIPVSDRRCRDWVISSQEHNHSREGELYAQEGTSEDEQSRNRPFLGSHLRRSEQQPKFEENNNSGVQPINTADVVVIANKSNKGDLFDGVCCMNYIRKHVSRATTLLDLTDPISTIISHLQNAKKIVVVLSTAIITLAKEISSLPRVPSQDYEFDALRSCIAYLVEENFIERKARMVLVTFRKTCNYAELPFLLKSKVYLMNDKKSRLGLKFRIAGKEQYTLSDLGPLLEIKPQVFSTSGKVNDKRVQDIDLA